MHFAAFEFQLVAPAPGGAPKPGTSQPVPAAPPAGGGGEPPGGGMLFMLAMLVPLMILMFWLPRSQQKKQEQAVGALKRGDRVVTQSGLVGKLVEVGDRYAKLEIAPGVNVQMLKTGLVGRDADPATATQKTDKPAAPEKKS